MFILKYFNLTIFFFYFSAELRSIELRVDPYPVRLYDNAPPNQVVLTITGYDNVTGGPLQDVTKSKTSDGDYFRIQHSAGSRWFLITQKTIDKPVNYTFNFTVYGNLAGVVRDQNVMIIVSKENLYAPKFEQSAYEFVVFRNSTEKGLQKLGEVVARDKDQYDYNSNFQYFIFDRNISSIFRVDPTTGLIGIHSDIPEGVWQMSFNVTAIDSGSPQKSSSVPITVNVTNLPPPEIFCVSVEGPKARICWKDPTNGSYVEKYQLQFAINGQNVTRHPVSIFGKRNEVCTQVKAGKLEAGNRLKFTVKVFNSTNWSPSSVQRFVNITKNGLYGDCPKFSDCSVWQPCKNAGECKTKPDLSYKCECRQGWGGQNCTETDLCSTQPCVNGGSFTPCEFQGTCVNTSNTEYECTCQEERYGKNCEFVNGCKLQLCENNSTCTNISTNGSVKCECQHGYFGDLCEHFNPCTSNPCQNLGICQNLTDTLYKCHCGSQWSGKNCEHRNQCLKSPCHNGAVCRPDDDSYICDCKSLFYGKECNKYKFCSPGANMCLNEAVCELFDGDWHQVTINKTMVANVTNWFQCRCPHGFTGLQCETEIKPCDLHPCGKGACRENGRSYVCHCPDGTVRDNCQTESCDTSATSHDRTGRYHWPTTLPGIEAYILCAHGAKDHEGKAYAFRKCQVGAKGRPEWLAPDTSRCMELTAAEADERLRLLMSYTNDASKLTPEQVANITYDLENVAVFALEDNVFSSLTVFVFDQIAQEMTTVISNLLETRESVLIESSNRNHSSERLVELLSEYADSVETDTNVTIETENINLMVVNVSANKQASDSYVYEPIINTGEKANDYGVKMTLPNDVIKGSGDEGVKIKFVTYRTSAFFIPKVPTPEEIVLKQRVMSASVHGVDVQNLTNPITYSIENIYDAENHTCVYWDVDKWSTRGVYTISTGGNTTDCYTTHLTSFSIILDPSPSIALPDVHDKALTYISYIGCAISIFGLAFTIVTYSMFRALNRERSGKILLNMCVSMLLMNASFILMAETTTEDGEALCIATAILLHYFLLTSLMWMVTEAINMYQALIKVFTKYSSYFILKRCIIAWGLPAVVVAGTMGVNKLDNYRSKTEFCFISQASPVAFYATLLGPACVILVINTIVFTLVARVIMKPRFKGSVEKCDKVTPAQVRGAFTVMVLLGVTWVFGPVAINESKLVFNYLFTILNSLQGFLIFVFRCLMNNEARMAWVLLIKTGTFKRRRGPIKSICADSSSSKAYADYKVNGSSGDSTFHTGKTILSSNGNLHRIEKNGDAKAKNGHMNGHRNGHVHNNNHHTENGKHTNKNDFTPF
ncbi:hypothetical protein FSP39_003656 [Pinctada imbricata]|uniref:Uncharacterized protein n=1 Tax=Pinctada imbricata TaxID=66713 RepID=A0AA89C0N3_PINIB|nr:hypothetical protein FSP39_003656 [Pinctada imbricata]